MTTITLPPEIEGLLAEEAHKQGTTPERLAIDCLRKHFAPPPEPDETKTLFDFLSGYAGTVNGTPDAWSENCGQRFTDGLVKKQQSTRE